MVYNPLWGKYFQIVWKKLWILMRSGGSGSGDRVGGPFCPYALCPPATGARPRDEGWGGLPREFVLSFCARSISINVSYMDSDMFVRLRFPECVDKQFFLFPPSVFMCLCVYSWSSLNTVLFVLFCFKRGPQAAGIYWNLSVLSPGKSAIQHYFIDKFK